MKKSILICFLITSLLITSVSALEKTKMYGKLEPSTKVNLILTYSASAKLYENQVITKVTDEFGNWDYKIGTDAGKINLRVEYRDIAKDFEITTGKDFEVNLYEKEIADVINETGLVRTTLETNTEDIQEEETKEVVKKSVGLSGLAVFDNRVVDKIFSKLVIYIFGVIIIVVLIIFFIYRKFAKTNIKENNPDLLLDAEKKLSEAQREISLFKNKSKIDMARMKLEEDRKALEDLEKGKGFS
ncbi:MAG: hypothetical protein ABIG37_02095 [Nanoarchaeota archaeon]|nr:hypothetical protein [Nanoarchaeota archaeon]